MHLQNFRRFSVTLLSLCQVKAQSSSTSPTAALLPTTSYSTISTSVVPPGSVPPTTAKGSLLSGTRTIDSTSTSNSTSSSPGTTPAAVSATLLISGRPVTTSSSSTSYNGTDVVETVASTTVTGIAATNTQPCNQYVEFCTRSYSNITYVAAHNSPFVRPNNVAANQDFDVTVQLNDGIRMLEGQTHLNDGVLHYCHTSCDLLDAGPAVDYYKNISKWMAANPFDVVTLLISNGDYISVNNFSGPFEQSGLASLAYVPPKAVMNISDWPTLGEMILSGKRLVVIMDYQANLTAVDYIIDEFGGSMWETPFSPTDQTFPCTVQRPVQGQPDPAQHLYMANHNLNTDLSLLGTDLLVPNTVELNITNSNSTTETGALGLNSINCEAIWGRPPNFLLVDYYNRGPINITGSVLRVAAAANNVTYIEGSCCGILTKSAGHGMDRHRSPLFSLAVPIAITIFFC